MAMKATAGSLRAYLVVAGAIITLKAAHDLGEAIEPGAAWPSVIWALAVWIPIVGSLVIGPAFVIAGCRLERALPAGASWIKRLIAIAGVMRLVELVLAFATRELSAPLEREMQGTTLGPLLGLGIAAYLYRKVVRLSAEAVRRRHALARKSRSAPPPSQAT